MPAAKLIAGLQENVFGAHGHKTIGLSPFCKYRNRSLGGKVVFYTNLKTEIVIFLARATEV
jgi:hypothetical protein